MAQQYINSISIAGLTLEINPAQYSQKFTKYGSFKRTISGGLVDVNINGKKLVVEIKGIAQSQIEEIKKRCALNKFVDFIDFVPIAEKDAQTRTVYEDLGSETIDSETIYFYIPTYQILITDFEPIYSGNVVEYTILGEEA